MKQIRIYVVDDHPIFRKGLAQLIEDEVDMEVCGEAEEVFKATRELGTLKPDLVIVDVTLKDTSGLELIKYISDHFAGMPALVLSMHDENIYAERAIKAGARGYIMKQEISGSVIKAIRQVLNGKLYLSENMTEKMLNNVFATSPSKDGNPLDVLSDREFEIFQLIGKGFKRKDIAEKLNLNVNTIGTYRERIKEKLQLSSSAELVAKALLWEEQEKGFKNAD